MLYDDNIDANRVHIACRPSITVTVLTLDRDVDMGRVFGRVGNGAVDHRGDHDGVDERRLR